MKVTALRSFPYSNDGFTIQHARKGDVIEVSASLAASLKTGDYAAESKDGGSSAENKMMGPPDNKATSEPREEQLAVEIPDNWRDLSWYDLRSLAARVSDDPIRNKDDAIRAVERELGRR